MHTGVAQALRLCCLARTACPHGPQACCIVPVSQLLLPPLMPPALGPPHTPGLQVSCAAMSWGGSLTLGGDCLAVASGSGWQKDVAFLGTWRIGGEGEGGAGWQSSFSSVPTGFYKPVRTQQCVWGAYQHNQRGWGYVRGCATG